MLTRKEVDEAPNGITYCTLGYSKRHITELVGMLEGMYSGDADEMSDEELKGAIRNALAKIQEFEANLDELFNGMNYLGDILKANGMIPAEEVGE